MTESLDALNVKIDYWEQHRRNGQMMIEVADRELTRARQSVIELMSDKVTCVDVSGMDI